MKIIIYPLTIPVAIAALPIAAPVFLPQLVGAGTFGLGVAGGVNAPGGSTPSTPETTPTPTPSPTPDCSCPIRVGRWMNPSEYQNMVNTGRVQEGTEGITNVAYPASPTSFRNAPSGDYYVEFDLPGDVIKNGTLRLKDPNRGWWFMYGPNSFPARAGKPVPPLPPATDIEKIEEKP